MSVRFGAVCLGAALAFAGAAGAQGAEPPVVLTEREALLPGIPEVVAPAVARAAEWSPDGKYVVAVREFTRLASGLEKPGPVEYGVLLWTSGGSGAKELWKVPPGGSAPRLVGWLPGTPSALLTFDRRDPVRPGARSPVEPVTRWILRVDARRGRLQPLIAVDPDTRITVSPASPSALLFSPRQRLVQVMDAAGRLKPLPLSPEELSPVQAEWTPDGQAVWVQGMIRPAGSKKPAARWVAVDVRTGRQRELSAAPALSAPAGFRHQAGQVRLRHREAVVREERDAQPIRPLWLEGLQPTAERRSLLAPDAEWASLSPRGDAVLYVSAGTAFVRPIVSVPREKFEEARNAARRQVLMSRMKQVGLAAMQYARDHQEQLPQAGEDVSNLLQPYVRRSDVFADLVYVYSGGPLSSLQEPGRTLLGYAAGPGGRASLFADGHVEWQKD